MVSGNFANRVRQVLSRRDNSSVEIIARQVGGSTQAFQVSRDDDIAKVINDALSRAGERGKVTVENGIYAKENDRPARSQISTKARGQTIEFQNSEIELEDGVDKDLLAIEHDDFKVKNGRLRGNRSNNDIQSVISAADIDGPSIQDVDVSGAPDGILFNNVNDGDIRASGARDENQEVDTGIRIHKSDSVTMLNASVSGFRNDGVRMEDSVGITGRLVVIQPEVDAAADRGFHMLGCRKSDIGAIIQAQGEVDVGLRDEAYDVGGADEEFSTSNRISLEIEGVNDIGIHISDAEKETVRGLVNGNKPNGRTTQAFLVDSPNGLANPQHDINISGITLTRITDTDQTGPNVGMRISGHYSKISETSTIGAGGNSDVNFKFGQSVPRPVVNALSGTTIKDQKSGKRAATDNNGQAEVDWSDSYAYGDKPILNVQLEQAGQWHVASWNTDANGRYIGVQIQVTDSSGAAVGNNVEVNAKVLGS